MNSYVNCPRCPLCPHIAQYNVQQLASHLCRCHLMKNSASILARTMLGSLIGYQEVVEVLKDFESLKEKMVSIEWGCTVGKMENKELEHKNKELDLKNKELELKNHKMFKMKVLSKVKVLSVKADQFSQTDPEYVTDNNEKQIKALKDMEIEELKQNIAQKKITVGMLKSQISDTETEIKTRKKENLNPEDALAEKNVGKDISKQTMKTDLVTHSEMQPKAQNLSQTSSLLTVLTGELKTVKDISLKKDEQIARLNNQITELEVKLKVFGSKEKKLQTRLKSVKTSCDKINLEVDKLAKEKESDKNVSTQLIESQRHVHEKEIQDLNQKLQNQINRSQGLKSREKSLMEEVKTLNAFTWKRNDQVKVLQVKYTDQADDSKINNPDLKLMKENLEVKDSEIYHLREKIVILVTKVNKLEKEVEQSKDQLFIQCKENFDVMQCFDSYKKVSQENISENDKIISCLEKDLESTKADAEIIVEEIEKYSRKNISYEKTMNNMKVKFGRYREIICLMKDSLSGLAAMHEDTSDKLIEAVRNTAHESQVVFNDVQKQLKGFEIEIASFQGELVPDVKLVDNNNEPIVIKEPEADDKLVDNNNEPNVIKEPEDSPSNPFDEDLGHGKYSKNAKLVAQDFSREFDVHFGERDGGKRSRGQESVSGDNYKEKNMGWSRKKRKFIE